MNRVYRTVFNRHLGRWQVAPETARSRGKAGLSAVRDHIPIGARTGLSVAVLMLALGAGPALAGGSGGNGGQTILPVLAGQAAMAQLPMPAARPGEMSMVTARASAAGRQERTAATVAPEVAEVAVTPCQLPMRGAWAEPAGAVTEAQAV